MNQVNSNKSLSDLFKEVQDIRYGRAEPIQEVRQDPRENIKFNKVYVVDKKFNVIGAVVGMLFVIMFFTVVNSNTILATSEVEKVAIGEFEQNQHPIQMLEVISNNISSSTKKEIITSELEIPFETTYTDNSQLPLNEEKIMQEGKIGYLDQTVIRTLEGGELIDEKIISEIRKMEPITKMIERGTSQFLSDIQAHVGDTVYTKENVILYATNSEVEDYAICMIYQFINIKLISTDTHWSYISVDGTEGYVKNEYLTSANVMPEVVELSRKQRILIGVNPSMEINKPSGLTRDDFIRVLSNHSQDTKHIIQDNAAVFYDVEQKYNINGLFLASIAIHESNWGTSNIAEQKKNLFGYGAYDSSPYQSSYTFESYQYGIELVAKVLVKYYINTAGTLIYDGEVAVASYYNGPTISGVNIRYASDTNWCNRVYAIMESLYREL